MFTPHIQSARIFGVGHVAPSPTWRTQPGQHTHHELIYVVQGRLHVAGGGRTHTGSAGDMLFYPAGATHEEWSDAKAPMESLLLSFSCPLNGNDGIMLLPDPRERIAEILRWLHEDALTGRNIAGKAHHAYLAAILSEFDRALDDPSDARVTQIRRHIREHISEPLSLGALARVAGLSRYHFVRTYKQATGLTPMADVRSMRVQHARQLIIGTSMPLKEIAELAGLTDVYSLSRAFRQCLSITPNSLRRTHRC